MQLDSSDIALVVYVEYAEDLDLHVMQGVDPFVDADAEHAAPHMGLPMIRLKTNKIKLDEVI